VSGLRRPLPVLVLALIALVAAIAVLSTRAEERRVTTASFELPSPRPDRPAKRKRERRKLTEAQAIERLRKTGWYVSRGTARGKLVALTFDDGPGPITPALMAELRRMKVPATFFQVADLVHRSPGMARATQDRPFAVGSHTASHPYLDRLPFDAQLQEIEAGANAIAGAGGRYPRLFRPPYGHWNADTIRAVKRSRMLAVFWSVSSRDWLISDPQALARRVIRLTRPGGIILMHDFGGVTREPTLQAVPIIVRALRRKGYRFVTVPRLLRDAPPGRRPSRPPRPFPL
jgi:peptidoglycan/xylan/chitin deacetylase (PgdA/CDA1 family)